MKDIKGLSSAEVQQKIKLGQTNKSPKSNSRTNLDIILYHFTRLSNVIILLAIFFLGFYGEIGDALLIGMVIMFNITSSVFQEIQAKSKLEKISLVNKQTTTVIRDGKEIDIDPEQIVLGDIVKLESGKYVFVDGEIIKSDKLLIDESVVTGESDYIQKKENEDVTSASFVVAGKGYFRATKVGHDSFVNQVTLNSKKFVSFRSPLEQYIEKIVQYLTFVTMGMLLILFSLNTIYYNLDQIELVENVVSIVGAMVPQGIIVSVTLSFMLGVIRMYQTNILVQKPGGIETMAAIDVLCMDKTGTITANNLQVKTTKINSQLPEKYKIASEIKGLSALTLLDLYTDYTGEKNKTISALNDYLSSESATELVENLNKDNWEVLLEISFTSKTKFSGLVVTDKENIYFLMLGSPEKLKEQLDVEFQTIVDKTEIEFADNGLRNILFIAATAKYSENLKNQIIELSETENDPDKLFEIWEKDELLSFKYQGIFGIEDELRSGARDILLSFQNQKIKPVIISGDGPRTLKSIVKALDIEGLDVVTTGKELAETRGEIELTELILSTDVFARVSPEQKQLIIKTFNKHYGKTAMIGDGVNDALALKEANLAISLGSGVNVAKNISDVILLDDNLANLAEVMSEGRQILFNTMRTAQVFIIKNVYSLLIIMGAFLFATHFPYAPKNLFLLSFLNANIPVITLILDRQPPKKVNFMVDLFRFVISGGIYAGIIGVGILIYATYGNINFTQMQAQTILGTFLIFVGIINSLIILNHSFRLRDMIAGSWRSLVGLVTFVIFSIIVTVPWSRNFFDLAAYELSYAPPILVGIIIYYYMFRYFRFESFVDRLTRRFVK
jgi:cation-transporting ATPase E